MVGSATIVAWLAGLVAWMWWQSCGMVGGGTVVAWLAGTILWHSCFCGMVGPIFRNIVFEVGRRLLTRIQTLQTQFLTQFLTQTQLY